MKVIFRVDASIWIGSGHVMRCLVLAHELRRNGYRVCFACIPQKGDMCEFIEREGFDVIYLSKPSVEIIPKNSADYQAWLQRTVEEDAQEFVEYLNDVSWVICDHYALGKEWQQLIKQKMAIKIVAIDDLVREHIAEFVIDQTLSRTPDEYHLIEVPLTGVEYALLNPRFSHLRPYAKRRISDLIRPKILISMGGIDLPNATLSVLKALQAGGVNTPITVILGKKSPHFSKVVSWCEQYEHIQHIEFSSDMASMMLSHDVSIGAPGCTSWERACLGLPNIVIPLADNQIEICERLVANRLSLSVSLEDIPNELLSAYQQVCDDWQRMHMHNMNACDGQGVFRVVSKIIEFDNERNDNLQ